MTGDRHPHPCVGCGFLVFDPPLGGGETCPLCDWRDDADQAADPLLAEGANPLNLIEHQRTVLIHLPVGIERQGAWQRDAGWRPATPADGRYDRSSRVCLLDETEETTAPYYWRR